MCKIPLREGANEQHLTQSFGGSHNQGVQVGGNNQAPITINPVPPEPKNTLIHRELITPIKVADTPVKHWWFTAAGVLGVIGNLASIVGVWLTLGTDNAPPLPTPPIWTMLLSFFLLILGLALWREKYLTVLFTGRTLETGTQDGTLYLTKITGVCRECDSPVEVATIGSKDNRITVVRCKNNPQQHRWEFDRTKLGDVGEDYRSR